MSLVKEPIVTEHFEQIPSPDIARNILSNLDPDAYCLNKANSPGVKCQICKGFLKKPVLDKCHHNFCLDCIKKTEKGRVITCPISGQILHVTELMEAPKILESILYQTHVHCTNISNEGTKCKWEGTLEKLTHHLDHCPSRKTKCPHSRCSIYGNLIEILEHAEKCKLRDMRCKKCQQVLPLAEVVVHAGSCLGLRFDLQSPNRSLESPRRNHSFSMDFNLNIARQNLGSISTETSNLIWCCPYAKHGCREKVQRHEIKTHLDNNRSDHEILLLKSLEEVNKENEVLRAENQSTKALLTTLMTTVTAFNSKFDILVNQISELRESNQTLVKQAEWSNFQLDFLKKSAEEQNRTIETMTSENSSLSAQLQYLSGTINTFNQNRRDSDNNTHPTEDSVEPQAPQTYAAINPKFVETLNKTLERPASTFLAQSLAHLETPAASPPPIHPQKTAPIPPQSPAQAPELHNPQFQHTAPTLPRSRTTFFNDNIPVPYGITPRTAQQNGYAARPFFINH